MDVRTRYCNFLASPGIYSYLEVCGLNHTRCETHFPQALESLQLVTIPSIYKKNLSAQTLFRRAQKSGHQTHKDPINSPGH